MLSDVETHVTQNVALAVVGVNLIQSEKFAFDGG